MVDALIPLIVPSSPVSAVSSACGGGGLPSVALPEVAGSSSMVCRIASVDSRGRVAEQSVIRALGWGAGQRLEIRVVSGVIVVRADLAGVFALARRCHVPIPAAVRRWCALSPGQRVLLAVLPEQRVLVIHTMAAVEEMLHARHAALLGGDAA